MCRDTSELEASRESRTGTYRSFIKNKKIKIPTRAIFFPSSEIIAASPMANMPSSSSPQSLSSASNSDNPPTTTKPTSHPSLSPKLEVDAGENNLEEKKPEIASDFLDVYLANHNEKFKKYEADYTRRLMAKYFSKKNLYGGDIFDESVTIDDELIKSSRWPCTRSYADPVQAFEDQNNSESVSVNDTPSSISNGKCPLKKNG